MAHVLSGRNANSPRFSSGSLSSLLDLSVDLVFRHALDNHLRHLLIPTRGSKKSRNSVNACHTSCRFRYSNETSRLAWADGGVKRIRRIRSIRVRYRPFTKNTRKERKAATECVVETRSVMRPRNWTLREGYLCKHEALRYR